MANEVSAQDKGGILETVLIKGDLSQLTAAQRNEYYMKVCESIKLNPLTQPFAYITLNGKLVLYALRAATDQLRMVHGISVVSLVESERDGVFIVKATVETGEGRQDIGTGAVTISNLKGEALANALMKCETKAKRRATLSICGLGMLDETEIEDIKGADAKAYRGAVKSWNARHKEILKEVNDCHSNDALDNVKEFFKEDLLAMKAFDLNLYEDLIAAATHRRLALNAKEEVTEVMDEIEQRDEAFKEPKH